MKYTILLIIILMASTIGHAQLKTTSICPEIKVDILKGKVGDLHATSTVGEVKSKYPCFSSAEDESATAKCGGGVFFKEKDIYFYTARNYVEIGPAFKGKLSIPLMGASRTGLYKWLGHPVIKDVNWDAYTMAYGIMILYFNKANKINKIRFSTESSATINLCE